MKYGGAANTTISADTLRWMCGGEVIKIESLTKRIRVPDINFISALLHFDTGATGVLLNSWTNGRRIFRVQMHAPGICVEAEHEGKGYLYADGNTKGVEYDTRQVAGSNENFVFGGFQAKNREFIDGVKSGQQPSPSRMDTSPASLPESDSCLFESSPHPGMPPGAPAGCPPGASLPL